MQRSQLQRGGNTLMGQLMAVVLVHWVRGGIEQRRCDDAVKLVSTPTMHLAIRSKQDESGQRQRTVEVGEQGEVVQVVDEGMQDEPPAQSATSMIPVKTEEIPATIPSPTRGEQLSRRKRGSRSTIDVVSMSRSLRHPPNTENIVVWRTDRVFYWDARLSYCCTKGRRNAYGFYEHWSRRR